ncbi:type II toxin-antitoxin system PemK/MazF family toxin [Nocardia nova]
MNRGDIWTYKGIARVRTVLVISADEMTAAGLPMTVEITDVPPRGARGLLAVPVPGHGYALVRPIDAADPARFVDHVGTADPATLDAVAMSIRAVLDL